MKIYIFVLFFLVCSILHSQDTWVKTYNPYNYEWIEGIGWTDLLVYYEVEDILIAQDGGYVVSGSFDRYLPDTPPFWWDHWGFLMKTDSDGNLLWAKKDSVDFLSETYNYAFTETDEGDFISIGYNYFGGGYMIKRDYEGNELWSIQYDDFGANSMCKTNDGNIIIGGRTDYNASIRKLSSDGETIWTKVIYLDGSIAYSVAQSSDGGFLITGINYGSNDILVIKTDTNGDSLWTRTFDVNNENNRGNCIIETSDNRIIVSGTDGFLGKFDNSGNTEFINSYSGWNLRSCLQTYDDNYVLFTGWSTLKTNDYGDTLWYKAIFQGGSNGDRSIRELDTNGLICIGCYCSNIYIYKTDAEGNYTNVDQKIISLNSTNLSNYPNPFNPETTIKFAIQNDSIIELSIYNIKGQRIKSLVQNDFAKGSHSIIWNGKNDFGKIVSSGVYYYKLQVNGKTESVKKCMLLK